MSKELKLEKVELLELENIGLKMQALQVQLQQLAQVREAVAASAGKRLGIDLKEYQIQADGRLTPVPKPVGKEKAA